SSSGPERNAATSRLRTTLRPPPERSPQSRSPSSLSTTAAPAAATTPPTPSSLQTPAAVPPTAPSSIRQYSRSTPATQFPPTPALNTRASHTCVSDTSASHFAPNLPSNRLSGKMGPVESARE